MQAGIRQKNEILQQEQTILYFPDGLLGFEHIKRYAIYDYGQDIPLKWMQAVNEPDISFTIASPFLFMPDYHVNLDHQHLHGLDVANVERVCFYVLITVPEGNPLAMTANLQGPIIVNDANHWAKQLVLGKGVYHTRHLLFPPSLHEGQVIE